MSTLSFEQTRELVRAAVLATLGDKEYAYICEMYPDSVIYEQGKDLVKRTYAVMEGKVTLGDATKVQRKVAYIPLQAACQIMAAVEGDETGTKWRVCAVKFGEDRNGVYWDQSALTAAVNLFNGAKVFALNDTQHIKANARPMGKSPREIVGALTAASVEADGIYADLVVMPSAAWLSNDLTACTANNIDFVYGLSVDISCTKVQKIVAGKKMVAPGIIKGVQVDVVYDPAAGGGFLEKLAAAVEAGQEGDTDMFDKLLAALKTKRPELYAQIQAGITAGTLTQDTALDQIASATVQDAGGDAANANLVAAVVAGLKETMSAGQSNELQQMQLTACKVTLTAALTASKLPEPVQDLLRTSYKDKVFTDDELQAAIQAQKVMLDKLTASGTVQGAGDVRIIVGRESVDKLQAAFDGLLGVPLADTMRDVPVFTSLRAAYVEMTGDIDITGVLNPQQLRRMQAAYGDTTFSYVFGNTLYRRLVRDYREITDYGVSLLVGSNIRNARDFRPLESINVGYYGDIPDVDTDIEDYPDLGEVSDEKVEYALKEKGGIITINRRHIINDDIRVVQKILSRLPRAARRTVARSVWTPLITNATYKGDNKPIFHADHGNLGSAAYSIDSAVAAKTSMSVQTEPGSNERLYLRPVTVSFPSELWGIVKNVNDFRPQAVGVDAGNSMYEFFTPAGMNENPLLTDPNDWYYFGDPNECEIVELAFLNGQQEPTMLVADNPANGQMFVGGRIQYRINHDHNAEVTDYRNAYKAVVAPA